MSSRQLGWMGGIILSLCVYVPVAAQDNTVFLESFSTDGDGTRYDMIGRGSDGSPDAWEHTFALVQSESFPLGPGGNITLTAPRVSIPWHSSIDNATADTLPIFDAAFSWATGGGTGLNVSFLVNDNPTAGSLAPGDSTIMDQLTGPLGHTVNLFDATSITPDTLGDVLLISDSVNVGNIYKSINIRDAEVPVVNYNVSLTDDLLLTTNAGSVEQLAAINFRQPSSLALPPGSTQDQLVNLTDGRASLPEYGQPRPGVSVLATYQGPFARDVTSLAVLDAMVDGTAASTTTTDTIEVLDLLDSTDPAGEGIWDINVGGDIDIPGGGGDDYGFIATGKVDVSAAGDYVFAVAGEDGARLRIGGNVVAFTDNDAFITKTATVNLTQGEHDIEWSGRADGGDAGFEVSFAPAANFQGVVDSNDFDVMSTEPFFEEIKIQDPGLEITVHRLDADNSPDVATNNPAVLAAPAGTSFNLVSAPFQGAVGDYLLGTDMDSIPDTTDVPPGVVEFTGIDLTGVADPKLTLNVAATLGMDPDADNVTVLVNDEELTVITPDGRGIMVDGATDALVTPHFQSLTYDLPSGSSEANIRIEVSNNGSGEAIGIDEVRITDGPPDPSVVATIPTVVENRIQHGENGYMGLEDTEIRFSAPDADNSELQSLNPDLADGGGEVQVLMRFNDLIGDGENQIPADQPVESATLSINITGPGTPLNLHQMLTEWEDDTATWNTLVGGVQADDVEAKAAPDDTQQANAGITTWDITESIRAWQADPESNLGWVMLPTGTNGVDFLSAEAIELDTGGLAVAPYIDFVLGSATVLLVGDLDGDGTVGFADFLILSANFGMPGTTEQGDIDGDGTVGFADFLTLSANFGESVGASAVPEPTGLMLGLSSLVGLTLRRRRCVR